MSETVIDASALLALLNAEPGADTVADALSGGVISAVNLSEVIGKLHDSGIPEHTIGRILQPLELEIVPFEEEQAYRTGLLHAATRERGLSPGDRACLGLAKTLGIPALTADRAWTDLSIGVAVKVIR